MYAIRSYYAYEYDYILHPLRGGPELLRIVLHTTPADRILAGTRRMRWTVPKRAFPAMLKLVGPLSSDCPYTSDTAMPMDRNQSRVRNNFV